MGKLSGSEKYLIIVSALVIVIFSALGFYLIDGAPKIKSLVAAGHNHILSFAYGALLFAWVIRRATVSEGVKKGLAVWMSLTFLGPLALIYAGFTGKTGLLDTTGVLFEGSFVVLWLIAAYLIATRKEPAV